MRVLVSGGTGFIGGPFVRHLVEQDHEVHVISRHIPSQAPPGGRVLLHHLDLLTEPGAVANLVDQVRPEGLVHLAWNATPGEFWASLDNLDWVRASLELFAAFVRCGGSRALFAGSCAEYDWSYGDLHERSTPTTPATLYGTAKNALRQLVERAASEVDASVTWARLFFQYGPREPESRLVPSVISALRAGREALVSEGSQVRDFLHVDDVARALVALFQSEAVGPINIGSGEGVAVRDVVAMLAELLGRPDLVRFGARPTPAEPPRLVAATELLSEATAFQPRFDLRHGLIDTIDQFGAAAHGW